MCNVFCFLSTGYNTGKPICSRQVGCRLYLCSQAHKCAADANIPAFQSMSFRSKGLQQPRPFSIETHQTLRNALRCSASCEFRMQHLQTSSNALDIWMFKFYFCLFPSFHTVQTRQGEGCHGARSSHSKASCLGFLASRPKPLLAPDERSTQAEKREGQAEEKIYHLVLTNIAMENHHF